MSEVDDNTCLQLWQSLRFSIDKSDADEHSADVFQLSDIYRSLMHQINFAGLTKRISSQCEIGLKEKYLTEYGKLIDDPQGINNYAEISLALAAHKRNESAQWSSVLQTVSDEELLKLIPENCRKNEENDSDKKKLFNLYMEEKHLLQQPKEIDEILKITDAKKVSGNQLTKQMSDCTETVEYKHSHFSAAKNKKQEQIALTLNSRNFSSYDVSMPKRHSSSLQQSNTGPENSIHLALHTTFCDNSNPKRVYCESEMHNNRFNYSSNGKEIQWKTANSRMSDFQNSFPPNGSLVTSGERKRKQPLDNQDDKVTKNAVLSFKTAKEQMIIEQHKKYGSQSRNSMVYGNSRKCLGTRRGLNSKFVPPVFNKNSNDEYEQNMHGIGNKSSETTDNFFQDEKLKNIDSKMIELMLNEIMDHGPPVSWDDIAGLEFAKTTIKEIVVWPMLRPDIFTGLRGPPKGILLFGPPGTGKTLIGKCIASQSKSTFFCISASSLTSKWVGEGEKLVRALFAVARCYQPAVIFIDEIDSLLTQRSDTEHESSRRIKTEFLVQLDGATTSNDERLLIVGATNRPQELDEAARRRLVKRLYIPLPESHARRQIVKTLLYSHSHNLTENDLDVVCERTEGYSGADMANLCKEAALGPIRSLNFEEIEHITNDQVRPIVLKDFLDALKQVRASVSDRDLELYSEWNDKYGSGHSV